MSEIIFLFKPFSFILDSFQNKIWQKIVFYLSDILNKMEPSMCWFENTQGDNMNGECIVVEPAFFYIEKNSIV
jgi:hypothetical protein